MGKGGGYSDLEYAIGREFGFVKEDVVIVTTVHPLQIMDGDLPETDHDFRIDFIRLRRRPRLRAETVASMGAFGEDMHFGVQARALPADECELRS
jgi:hypothetical protein